MKKCIFCAFYIGNPIALCKHKEQLFQALVNWLPARLLGDIMCTASAFLSLWSLLDMCIAESEFLNIFGDFLFIFLNFFEFGGRE